MIRYFNDFAVNAITYRPLWIEVTKGANTHRALDNEAMLVFQRQGWTPMRVGYVRLFDGQVDTGFESSMTFCEFETVRSRG